MRRSSTRGYGRRRCAWSRGAGLQPAARARCNSTPAQPARDVAPLSSKASAARRPCPGASGPLLTPASSTPGSTLCRCCCGRPAPPPARSLRAPGAAAAGGVGWRRAGRAQHAGRRADGQSLSCLPACPLLLQVGCLLTHRSPPHLWRGSQSATAPAPRAGQRGGVAVGLVPLPVHVQTPLSRNCFTASSGQACTRLRPIVWVEEHVHARPAVGQLQPVVL